MKEEEQNKWATHLKKTQRQTAERSNTPLTLRKKQLTEEFDFYKNKLAKSIEEQNGEAAQKYVNRLIELRAKQFALFIEEEKNKNGGVYDDVMQKETKRYYEDCHRLVRAVESAL